MISRHIINFTARSKKSSESLGLRDFSEQWITTNVSGLWTPLATIEGSARGQRYNICYWTEQMIILRDMCYNGQAGTLKMSCPSGVEHRKSVGRWVWACEQILWGDRLSLPPQCPPQRTPHRYACIRDRVRRPCLYLRSGLVFTFPGNAFWIFYLSLWPRESHRGYTASWKCLHGAWFFYYGYHFS